MNGKKFCSRKSGFCSRKFSTTFFFANGVLTRFVKFCSKQFFHFLLHFYFTNGVIMRVYKFCSRKSGIFAPNIYDGFFRQRNIYFFWREIYKKNIFYEVKKNISLYVFIFFYYILLKWLTDATFLFRLQQKMVFLLTTKLLLSRAYKCCSNAIYRHFLRKIFVVAMQQKMAKMQQKIIWHFLLQIFFFKSKKK